MLLLDSDLTRLSPDPDLVDHKIAVLRELREKYGREGVSADVLQQLDDHIDNLTEWRARLEEIRGDILQ